MDVQLDVFELDEIVRALKTEHAKLARMKLKSPSQKMMTLSSVQRLLDKMKDHLEKERDTLADEFHREDDEKGGTS